MLWQWQTIMADPMDLLENGAGVVEASPDPSNSIFDRPSAATARLIEAVCVTSALTAPMISASPSLLPAASIWS